MKTLKVLTVCLILCCIFTGNAFAQILEEHGLGISKGAESPVKVGEPYVFSFTVRANSDDAGDTWHLFGFSDVVFAYDGDVTSGYIDVDDDRLTWTLIDGATWFPSGFTAKQPTDDYIVLPDGSRAQMTGWSFYTVEPNDLLLNDSKLVNQVEIQAQDQCDQPSTNCGGELEFLTASASATVTGEPCLQVFKDACGESKVDDTIVYDVNIVNCGDLDLTLVTVIDELPGIGDITALAEANGGSTLAPGENCTFQVPYDVLESDPDPLVNDVNAVYEVTATAEFISDTDTVSVDLVNPSYYTNVECIDAANGIFKVTFVNDGDINLIVDPDPDISPIPDTFELLPGIPKEYLVTKPLEGTCGCGSSTLSVDSSATIGPVNVCNLPNRITDPNGTASATCEIPGCDPNFVVYKTCLGDVDFDVDPNAVYDVNVINTGNVPLDIYVIDTDTDPNFADGPISLNPGENWTETLKILALEEDCNSEIGNTVQVWGFCKDQTPVNPVDEPKTATAYCDVSCGGGQGCTPGFWKNHPACWCGDYAVEPYGPDDFWLIQDIFTGLQDADYINLGGQGRYDKWDVDKDTMMDALNYGGGRGIEGATRNMLRHATAAFLNACSDNVQYPEATPEGVQKIVNDALAASTPEDFSPITDAHIDFAKYNEENPCPINARCQPIADDPD